MDTVRNILAGVGCLFIGAGVGLAAESIGASTEIGNKAFLSVAVLLIIWVLK